MSIEQFDTELARLQAEIISVERAPRSFDEVWPQVEAELADAEAAFRRHGPRFVTTRLPEEAWQRHQAAIGASMVANRKAVLDSERARIKAATEGGLSQADRTKRLDQLRTAVLRLAAQRELALRDIEGEGVNSDRARCILNS